MKHRLPKSSKFIAPFIVKNGRKFRLKDYNPASTRHLHLDEREADKLLEESTQHLSRQQSMLYAQDRWALLLIFQAMDAGGKDSVIRHVMSGVNPQGCDVHTFKAPSQEELDHDFLWKAHRALTERGRIGIFNRVLNVQNVF